MTIYKSPFKLRAGVREVASANMPTLGEELRHKREQRGITLAEIAEATRIGTRFLKAIETNNFATLPGGIFTRSFIRAYAKHVGMNEDEAIGLYLQQVAEPTAGEQEALSQLVNKTQPPERITKVTPSATPFLAKQTAPAVARPDRFEPVALRRSTSRVSWPTIVIGAGIVIFVVIMVIALVKMLNQGASENASQTTSTPSKNGAPKQAPQAGSQSAAQPGPRASTEPASTQPAESGSPPPVAPGQPLVVKIEAAGGDSWISYQADDAKPTSFILRKGESRDVPPAQKQVAVSYGNRMVLKIRINNRDANFPPDTPKFKAKVVISHENLQTFFQ
jgi:cytoskeletal protein RodZ